MRLWAYLLIAICGFNAIGVSGVEYLSEKDHEAAAFSRIQPDDQTTDAANVEYLSYYDHSGTDKLHDCGTQHKNGHQCHLGHCLFLVSNGSEFIAHRVLLGLHSLAIASYFSIDLSGPRKPPRA